MTDYTGFITGLERIIMRIATSVFALIMAAGLAACGGQPTSNAMLRTIDRRRCAAAAIDNVAFEEQ